MNFKNRTARKLYMKREAAMSASIASCLPQNDDHRLTGPASSREAIDLDTPGTFRHRVPHPGLATRQPALKQAKTSRGHSIYRGIILWHESLLELRVSYLLQTWHHVREIHSQYPRVTYVDAQGKTRTHTFDYYVVFEDGRRLAIAVKMYRKRAAMLDMLARIEAYGIAHRQGPRLADETRLMTEHEANVASFHNCSEILAARDRPNPAEIEALRKTVRRMTGRFRFMALLSGCPNMAARRSAIWRLIDLGELAPEATGRIDELTWLKCGLAPPRQIEAPTVHATTRKGDRTCNTAIPSRPAHTRIPSYLLGVPTAIAKARRTTSRSSRMA